MGSENRRALARVQCARGSLRRRDAGLRILTLLNRILVIRGGALGDFVLTLPAIKLLREKFPQARLEILGYKHIAALAEKRFYADAIRSIEYGALAGFFAQGAELPNELCDYFGTFDLVVSYLFDPDEIFATNLQRCSVKRFIVGPGKLSSGEHAAHQLARPLEQLGLPLRNPFAEIFPSAEDKAAASKHLPPEALHAIAIHPGSGSPTKNWPIDKWAALGNRIGVSRHLIVISGEADTEIVAQLHSAWKNLSVSFVPNLALPTVAAILARSDHFIGHDSGISHIAAAVGTPCTLLFGPSDPEVWAPLNPNVRVVRPTSQNLDDVSVEEVLATLTS